MPITLTELKAEGSSCPICDTVMHLITPTAQACMLCGIILREAPPFRVHLHSRSGAIWEVIGHLNASVICDTDVNRMLSISALERDRVRSRS